MSPQPPSSHYEEDQYMRAVDDRSKCEKIASTLYNREDGTFLGRTAKGWGLLLIFYSTFYAVLAALFALCMYVMLQTLPDDRPTFTLGESLIGTNPGMGFRPQFVSEGSLIWYNAKNDTQVARYVKHLDDYLDEYTNTSSPGAYSRVPCDFQRPPPPSQACDVPANFGPCTAANSYGYKSMQPCIFIKLNRIFDWEPEYYTSSSEAPSMPPDLKSYIDALSPDQRKQVWISCKGEAPGDVEGLNFNSALSANITYYPSRGIPSYYYPYRNQLGYLNPLVAVQFNNLEPGRIVNIRCRAWAKNIVYSQSIKELSGSTHIEIMVDNTPEPTVQ